MGGVSGNTVRSGLRELEDAELLEVEERSGVTSHYTLVLPRPRRRTRTPSHREGVTPPPTPPRTPSPTPSPREPEPENLRTGGSEEVLEEEAGAHTRKEELARLLAPLERADGARLNGQGLDVVRAAYFENPAAVAVLVRECAGAVRVKSRRGLLIQRIRRGDHRADLLVALTPAVCPECGLGGGYHEDGCSRAGGDT
jgi:hypothetical protein